MKVLVRSKLFRFVVFLLLNLVVIGGLLFNPEPIANLAQALYPLGGGDTCTAATPILGSFPYTDSGTTVGATENYDILPDVMDPTCLAPVGWALGTGPAGSLPRGASYTGTGTGPDVAYSVRTNLTCRLQATMDPTTSVDLSLVVYLAQCTSSLDDCVVVSDTGAPGAAETVQWEAAAGQNYYIVVDGYATGGVAPGPSGPYSLQVTEITAPLVGCQGVTEGPPPDIAVSTGGVNIPDNTGTVNFGTTPLGTPVDKTFVISNTGSADLLLVEPISLPSGFSVLSSFGSLTVAPGGSTTFQVRLTAATAGSYSGQLSFGNNDGDETPYNFTVNGTVLAPEIAVSTGGTNIPDGTGSVDFGSTPEGAPVSKIFTVSNTGNTTLNLVEPISLPSGFSLLSSFGSLAVAPAGSITFEVQLDAAAAGVYSGQLSFGNDDNDENPFNFTISGGVGTPEIAVSTGGVNIPDGTGAVDFGTTPLGTPVTKTFTISNTGTLNLILTPPISLPSGFSLVSSFGSLTVAPGASTTFQARLTSAVAGSYSGQLSFANSDGDENPYNFTVSGVVAAPEIAVSTGGVNIPDGTGAVNFGTTLAGAPVDKTFTISNTGTATLTLVEPVSLPAGFSLLSSFGSLAVAPGGSTTFQVRLTAAAVGSYSGQLSFGNNDSNENPFNFTISGVVNAPEIAVSTGGVNIPDGTGSVAFGTTPVGSSLSKTFTISNHQGTANLTLVEPISLPSGFSLVSSFGSLTVAPGASTTFQVRLTAAAAGSYSGQLSFANSDSDENPYNFTINGVVIAPEIAVSTGGVDIPDGTGVVSFGTTPVGTSVDKSFTITNTGTADLLLVEPVNLPAGFSLIGSFGSLTIAPGASTTFHVRLTAAAAGNYSGQLSFSNNDGDENPFNFTISGGVGAAEIAVSTGGVNILDGAGAVDFGTTLVGMPVEMTFTITNTGNVDLTLVEPVSLPAGFSLVDSFGSLTVAPGASTTFHVKLDAATPGAYSGTLSFGNSDSDENPFNFTIRGQVNWPLYFPLISKLTASLLSVFTLHP